jgi:ADP-heptose:LPS heptosyltransferase
VIGHPQNILVLDFGQLGDVVLSVPALSAIRKRFAGARITVATGTAASPVVEMSGLADGVLSVDRVRLRDGPKLRSLAEIARLVGDVRRAGYDLAIDLHSLSESNLLAYVSGAPERLFARRGGRSLDFLSTLCSPREDGERHIVDRYLDVLKPLGITNPNRIPHLPTRPEDDRAIEQMLLGRGAASNRPLVGLFPGASTPLKRWPLARFAQLGRRLEEHDGARVILFAGPEESAMLEHLRASFSPGTILFDRLSLTQLASAAARLDLFVSNDSGPMHLAAAVGAPVLLLLGASVRAGYWFGPVGQKHRVLVRPSLLQITAGEAHAMARSMLQAGEHKSSQLARFTTGNS